MTISMGYKILFFAAVLLMSCSENPLSSKMSTSNSTPTLTANKLLSLHGLLGRQPEDRDQKTKDTLVSADKNKELIVDLSGHSEFLTDLYVGFIVGALARNQSNIFETRQITTAQIDAGSVKIHFDLVDNFWKINLARSVPIELKKRAAYEEERYKQAKSAGKIYQ